MWQNIFINAAASIFNTDGEFSVTVFIFGTYRTALGEVGCVVTELLNDFQTILNQNKLEY